MSLVAPAIIIDTGSGVTKAGYAGQKTPCCILPSIVGRPLVDAPNADGQSSYYVGHQAQEKRGILALTYPIQHGVVTNWDDVEKIWHHVFYNELRELPEEHAVMLTESAVVPNGNREKAAELMFESFNAAAMNVSKQPVLAMYGSGRTSGLTLDIGEGVTHAVPIYEGSIVPHAIQRLDLAGGSLTDYLVKLVQRNDRCFNSSSEREVIRDIKEKLCFIAPNFERELLLSVTSTTLDREYKLPDGQPITLGAERFRCPEALFQPRIVGMDCIGIHKAVHKAIKKCDIGLRKHLYENIVLSGGSTMFPYILERMKTEIEKLAPHTTLVKIITPLERKYSVWIGGSILAALQSFQHVWVSKQEYEDYGPSIIHRSC